MSDLVQKIIKSPAAKKMLRNVTRGFYDRSQLGLLLFEIIGREWDEAVDWVDKLKHEAFVQSSTWSIAEWEKAYGIMPNDSLPLNVRRREVIAKKTAKYPANPETIRKIIETFTGADTQIDDLYAPYRFYINVDLSKTTLDFRQENELIKTINRIKPAHLDYAVRIASEKSGTVHAGGAVHPKYIKTVIKPYTEK